MTRAPNDGQERRKPQRRKTLAEILVRHVPNSKIYPQLEEYRIEYEAIHGPTDLTKRYTSTWSVREQNWLMENDIKAYFDGLPPFYKAYTRGMMELAAREGNLDDMPDDWLRLFAQRRMVLDHEKKGRQR